MALPLILGGITLAAVGYGIKKYCDDNDDCLVSIGDKIGDAIDKVDDAVMGGLDRVEAYFQDKTGEEKSNKMAIYRNCQEDQKELFQDEVQPFMTLFAQVEHSPFKALEEIEPSFAPMDVHINDISAEARESIKEYVEVMERAGDVLQYCQAKLKSILEVSSDYQSYATTAKQIIEEGYGLAEALQKMCITPVLHQDGTINNESKSVIERITKLLGTLRHLEDESNKYVVSSSYRLFGL